MEVARYGNRFIRGHNNKGNFKPKPEPTLCKCGCGELALPGNDYIVGHCHRGMKHSEETLIKMAGAARNRVYTEDNCKRISDGHLKEKDPLPDDYEIDKDSKMATNKNCASYLGCYIAERLLEKIFKNVKMMPHGNHGFDVICNRDLKIDIKSAATGYKGYWYFNIGKNKIADYFLCVAFEDRNNLNPVYLWLIPDKDINHIGGIRILKSTIPKWSQYEQPIDKVIKCCDEMKGDNK